MMPMQIPAEQYTRLIPHAPGADYYGAPQYQNGHQGVGYPSNLPHEPPDSSAYDNRQFPPQQYLPGPGGYDEYTNGYGVTGVHLVYGGQDIMSPMQQDPTNGHQAMPYDPRPHTRNPPSKWGMWVMLAPPPLSILAGGQRRYDMHHEMLTQRAPGCIGAMAKKGTLSQHFVTHVVPPLGGGSGVCV